MSIGNSSSYAEPKIGRMLELARRERGLSLHQVEQATKIRARYLWELEHENFDVLPAVYVQGSLKTYANFLGLDGEALVQELRRRQASHTAAQDPAYAEHPKSNFSDRAPILLGGAVGAASQEMTEDKGVGAASVPVGNSRLYLVSGAFLVLILVAVALALTLARDRQPAVSQVREPLISQAPPEASPVSNEKAEKAERPSQPQRKDDKQGADKDDKQGVDNKDNSSQLEQPAEPPAADTEDEGAGQTAQTEQDDSRPAQDPGNATATPSASPIAETAPAAAEPDGTSTSPTAEPDTASTPPPATEAPAQSTEAPAQRRETGLPPAGGTQPASPGSRDNGDFDVQIRPGSEDLVRITGDPVDD